MISVYREPVNVQARLDGRPNRFVWRCRLYAVRAILEHWVIKKEAQDQRSEPGQQDLEFWRVEAARGPGTTVGVYELRREAATTAWSVRALPDPRPPTGDRTLSVGKVPRRSVASDVSVTCEGRLRGGAAGEERRLVLSSPFLACCARVLDRARGA
jgi:hypothetical protein